MDPFTQRMLERAKARREKLDTQLSNAGHDVKLRRSPLRDANAIVMQASKLNSSLNSSSKLSKNSPTIIEDESIPKLTKNIDKPSRTFDKTPEKCKTYISTTDSDEESSTDKENASLMISSVKSKLQRLGKLYSDDESRELSSPIHRTEEKFSAEEITEEVKCTKRSGARLDRLAALASTINNWEDDLSHPQLTKKCNESKAEKIQAKMNEQVKSGLSEPQPSTSGINRWKSNGNDSKNNRPINTNTYTTKQFKWDKQVLNNLESQGFTRTESNSRLVYDYKACSQEPKTPPKDKDTDADDKREKKETTTPSKAESTTSTVTTKSSWLSRNRTPEKKSSTTPDKNTTTTTANSSGNRTNRFAGFSGSPKSKVSSPGSVLSKASLFESKSLATKAKDPAEMSLSERMALFERNKGEALIPKAPLTLSVPTSKLQESQKTSSNHNDNFNKSTKNNESMNKSVSNNRAIFEQGFAKQELENDILRDTQAERKKELEMLRSRFNKNKEVAQVAAGSCIRPRQNSETTNGSPKNSPICPVKPTPATDHIPPPPPLPQNVTPQSNKSEERTSSKRQVIAGSSPPSQTHYQKPKYEVKRIRVSPPKPGNLYPDLTGLESESTETETDSEFTVVTTEPETITLEERSDSELDTDDCNLDEGNTSFETSILKVVTRQQFGNNKRQIESDAESSTSDISVLDEMDEYLDECLANQESSSNHGPTPPKLNRGTASPSMASSSFKFTGYRSPIKVTPKSPANKKEPYIVEGNHHVPLMHSVSFYRKQQQLTPKTPIKQISRVAVCDAELSAAAAENRQQKEEAALVGEKIKRLMDEVCKQQTIIGQASQALNLCTATVEFSGSREQVEGERLLLVATHRRQAALNEIQRLKIEGTLRPAIPGESPVQESGSLTISALTLPLKKDFHGNSDMCLHFLCLVRHLDTVIATPVVQAEFGDSCVRFPSTLKLDDLYSDFKITIEVYSLETRAEILPHEVKYHIHNGGYGGSGIGGKKGGVKTPKKLLKQERLVMPSVQSPAGPAAVRSPAFALSGYVVFSLKEVNRQQFTLNKVPRNSALEGHLQMHVSCELSISVEHRGFLTMFEDVSGFGAWHRRWCLLKGDTLSYWKYPDDERKKTPIGSLELQGVVTKNVGLVSRDICARPNTFLLETVRPAQPGDADSLIVVKNGSHTTIRHLLSADTKEERLEWCSKINQTLNLIRAWGVGDSSSSGY